MRQGIAELGDVFAAGLGERRVAAAFAVGDLCGLADLRRSGGRSSGTDTDVKL